MKSTNYKVRLFKLHLIWILTSSKRKPLIIVKSFFRSFKVIVSLQLLTRKLMWAITLPQLLSTVSCTKIFDLSNKCSYFSISNFVLLREKPTRTNASVNLDFVQTNVTIYCYKSWKLSTLNSSKADGIQVWLLKENADLLAGPVSEILNSLFLKSRLPPSWKEADVVLGSQNKGPSMILTNTSVPFPSRLSYPNSLKTILLRNTLNQVCYKI